MRVGTLLTKTKLGPGGHGRWSAERRQHPAKAVVVGRVE